MKKFLMLMLCSLVAHISFSKEYFVSQKIGDDKNNGTQKSPFKTIQRAADIAVAGDIITVAEGVYREEIVPKNGGEEGKPIVYQAVKNEKVQIKGSEIIKGWTKHDDNIWKVVIPNEFFKGHNPFKLTLSGDWFEHKGRTHLLGEVFLNGKAMYDKESIEKLSGETVENQRHLKDNHLRWTATVDDKETIIYAVFGESDPNKETVEISIRKSCFCPEKEGINYITIRGFDISQATARWAPPTRDQIGMITALWCKGWIIEENTLHDVRASAITLAKYSDSLHLDQFPMPDERKGGYERYIECVFRAKKYGWNKDNIGSHIVRNNTIFNCGQTGICGSMGASWSIIENNEIYNIWRNKEYNGAEMGGIKFHAALDTVVRNNYIHRANMAIWMDWMTQGTQIIGNICNYTGICDIFIEVSHGPFLVANNVLASPRSVLYYSGGGAYVHNMMGGYMTTHPDPRYTPYFFENETEVAGFISIDFTDNRFLNNMFANRSDTNMQSVEINGFGLSRYDSVARQISARANLYFNDARPYKNEKFYALFEGFNNDLKIVEEGKEVFVVFNLPENFKNSETQIVTSETLGKAFYPSAPFVNPDGSRLVINEDLNGNPRPAQPMAGPFEDLKSGINKIKVFQKR